MLTIREEQWRALADEARRAYVDRACERAWRRWPEECEKLGPAGVRERIELGVTKASAYGLTLEPDVNLYLDLMFRWGDDFDTSPQTPWAAEILDWSQASGSVKARALAAASGRAQEQRLVQQLRSR